MDDEILITAAPHGSPQPRPNQSSAVGRESIALQRIGPAFSALG